MNLLLGLPLGLFHMFGTLIMLLLRLAPLILTAAAVITLLRKRRGTAPKKEKREKPPKEERRGPKFTGPVYTVDYKEVREEDPGAEPDLPEAFGQKPGWLAIRSRDPEQVMEALGLQNRKRANWKSGLASVSHEKWFVSPSLDGWVLVIGAGERPLPAEQLERLSRRFFETQAFAALRERSLFAWSLYRNGQCIRAYGMHGGQIIRDEGELTAEEIALGFGRFPRKTGGSREGFPDREAVLEIAAAWGLDPMLEGRNDPPSLGWLCTVE